MSTYIRTIAGRILFANADDYDAFCEEYANLFRSDDRVIDTNRGVGTGRKKKDRSREQLLVRIPRLRFRRRFSPWDDDEVRRADDFGFVITCTDGFLSGSYRTPDETDEVNLAEWAAENDYREEPQEQDFDSYDDWWERHDYWEEYIEKQYHEDHRHVFPEIPGTLWRDTWQSTLSRFTDGGLGELFE